MRERVGVRATKSRGREDDEFTCAVSSRVLSGVCDGRRPHPTLSKWTRPIIRASVLGEGALRCGTMSSFTGRASFSCRQSRATAKRNDFRTVAPNSGQSGCKNPWRCRFHPPPKRVRLREVLVRSVLQHEADRSTSLRLTVKRFLCSVGWLWTSVASPQCPRFRAKVRKALESIEYRETVDFPQ